MRKIQRDTGLNISLYPIKREYYWQDLIKNGTIDFYKYLTGSMSLLAVMETLELNL